MPSTENLRLEGDGPARSGSVREGDPRDRRSCVRPEVLVEGEAASGGRRTFLEGPWAPGGQPRPREPGAGVTCRRRPYTSRGGGAGARATHRAVRRAQARGRSRAHILRRPGCPLHEPAEWRGDVPEPGGAHAPIPDPGRVGPFPRAPASLVGLRPTARAGCHQLEEVVPWAVIGTSWSPSWPC